MHMLRVTGTLGRIRSAVQGPRMPSVVHPSGARDDDDDIQSTYSEHEAALAAAAQVAAAVTFGAGTGPVFGETNGADATDDAADAEAEMLRSKAAAHVKRALKARRRASFTPKITVPKRSAEDEGAASGTPSGVLHCMLVDGLQVRT